MLFAWLGKNDDTRSASVIFLFSAQAGRRNNLYQSSINNNYKITYANLVDSMQNNLNIDQNYVH